MAFTLDQIPKDVQMVWALKAIGQPIGIELMKEVKKVMKENPIWFPEDPKSEIFPPNKHSNL